MNKPLSTGPEWTIELIQTYDKVIGEIAAEFGLDTFPNQIEIISSQQMIDACAMIGLPIGYHHWSFGKHFSDMEKSYRRGHMGLAYEIVINANPCIAYLMEENSMAMQALVIAHACYGHNAFFKNNYLFKLWTTPDAIIDYMVFAKHYIAECEQKYGIDAVEQTIDACHALMSHGVNRYKHPPKLSLQEEKIRQRNREKYLQSQVNDLWRTIPTPEPSQTDANVAHFPEEPQENILYFLEKNSPTISTWQREVIRIVRKIAQYFYPQRQTKVMNEGFACFWHYILINTLYDRGYVTDEFLLEVLHHHTNVIAQLPCQHPGFSGLNPYTLGYHMWQDIKRIAEEPTAEDRQWFPEIAGHDWKQAIFFAMENFKDESFIAQYLSPKLIRDLRLFTLLDDDKESDLIITAIHDEHGYKYIRESLSNQYNIGYTDPSIEVYHVDVRGNRTLFLRHNQVKRRRLDKSVEEVLKHLRLLWGFPVVIESFDDQGKLVETFKCP